MEYGVHGYGPDWVKRRHSTVINSPLRRVGRHTVGESGVSWYIPRQRGPSYAFSISLSLISIGGDKSRPPDTGQLQDDVVDRIVPDCQLDRSCLLRTTWVPFSSSRLYILLRTRNNICIWFCSNVVVSWQTMARFIHWMF